MALGRFFGTKTDPIPGGSTVNLPAPTGVAATPSGSGGTLAAGTYYYRVTLLNAAGETVGSEEVSAVVTGSTSSVSIAWDTDSRATSARVYRGTASGMQTTYYTDANGIGPLVDTGAAGTAGTVPNVSTARITIPAADDIWPITGATVDKNVTHLDRNEEITGYRGNPVVEEFRKDPRETVSGLAYQRLLEQLWFKAMGGADQVTGSDPAAITHRGEPIGYGGDGLLPALFTHIVRDGQTDKMSGVWVNSISVTFGLDGHGTFEAELWGLYHVATAGGSVPVLTRHVRDVKTLKLRDLRAYFDGSPVIVPGVTSVTIAFNNNIVDDSDARFAAGESIDQQTDDHDVLRRVWYPNQHFLGGSQSVSGSIGFSTPKHAEDVKHDLAQSEQLVLEVEGGLMATTPVAKEMMRWTVKNAVRSGGGADALQKEGLQKSSYEFMGGIGADGSDIVVEAVNDDTTPITT